PDMLGWTVLNQLKLDPSTRHIPVQIVTLEEERQHGLARGAFAYLVKEPTTSGLEAAFGKIKEFTAAHTKRLLVVEDDDIERASIVELLDDPALFLHRVVTDLPPAKQQMLERLHGGKEALRNRKVLVVDDDARNIFALTSLLENHEMEVMSATNGRQAIDLIQRTPDIDMVLMDIMMPDMDGYETMREIRSEPRLRTLPILALTAKAMKGDREKCLEAGASDYIAKPVNTDQLLSLLRVWLYRYGAHGHERGRQDPYRRRRGSQPGCAGGDAPADGLYA